MSVSATLFPATIASLIHFFFIWQGATMVVLDPPSPLPAGTTPGELLWHVLLDRPIGNRGRTALYGRKHLAQIVAIKRLHPYFARDPEFVAMTTRFEALNSN